MRINPVQVAKLFKNIPGQTVKGGSKFTKYGFSIVVPENAVRCDDIVRGVGKKGYFKVLSFRDAEDNLIQRCTRYRNKNEYTDVITDLDMSTGIINRKKKTINGIINGKRKIEQIEYSSIVPYQTPNESFLFIKQSMAMTPNGDFGSHELLQQGKKPAGMSYKYSWDGKPVKIGYKNIHGQKLDFTDEELLYLPFINRQTCFIQQDGQTILTTKDFTTGRVKEKISLAQIIQEKVQGIKKGFLPRAKAVKQDELVAVQVTKKSAKVLEQERKMCFLGEALPDGQIHIASDVQDSTDGLVILGRMAHEMKHESDFIKMNRGGKEAFEEALNNLGITYDNAVRITADEKSLYNSDEFYKKCTNLGLFKKGTSEYKESVELTESNLSKIRLQDIKTLAEEQAGDFEGRALTEEKNNTERIQNLVFRMVSFLFKFVG